MKKLLLITKLFIVVILLTSCQSNSKTISKSETKPKPSSTALGVDTNKQSAQTSSTGTSSSNNGTKNDTTKQSTSANGINHNSQNQAQLDSIKAIKTKDKNKKDK